MRFMYIFSLLRHVHICPCIAAGIASKLMKAGLKLSCHLSQLDMKHMLELRPCLRDAHEAQGTFPLSHTCLATLVKIIYIYIYIYICMYKLWCYSSVERKHICIVQCSMFFSDGHVYGRWLKNL